MNLDSIQSFFDTSPSVRLMRMNHAPLALNFLDSVFKSGERIVVTQSDLRSELATYQDLVHAKHPDALTGPPERYLTEWCDNGLLHRFLNADSVEPQYQLTRHTEEVLRFVDGAIARGGSFVGTESRLRLVIDTLTDVVQGASSDPDRRLALLKTQRAELDREIEAIELGESVKTYSPVEIRERFQTSVDLLKALQSDFRAVEENFREIASQVQQRQQDVSQTRGEILGYALDAEDLLKQQDQGISFFSFVNFLFAPGGRESFRQTIEELESMNELEDQGQSLQHVRGMVPALLAEAEKVMRTTGRLSTTLRRLLDTRATSERRRVASVIRDIRALAMKLRDKEEAREIGLCVDGEIEFSMPLEKMPWTRPKQFTTQKPEDHVVDPRTNADAFMALARMQRLDWKTMRDRVDRQIGGGQISTLGEMMIDDPPKNGVVELLGFIQIAHDDGHAIDEFAIEKIRVDDVRGRDRPLEVTVPLVTFSPLPKKPK